MQISNEEVYNIDELIKILQKEKRRSILQDSINKTDESNREIYIKDLDSDEYKRIVCIRIDDDGDLIIETQQE